MSFKGTLEEIVDDSIELYGGANAGAWAQQALPLLKTLDDRLNDVNEYGSFQQDAGRYVLLLANRCKKAADELSGAHATAALTLSEYVVENKNKLVIALSSTSNASTALRKSLESLIAHLGSVKDISGVNDKHKREAGFLKSRLESAEFFAAKGETQDEILTAVSDTVDKLAGVTSHLPFGNIRTQLKGTLKNLRRVNRDLLLRDLKGLIVDLAEKAEKLKEVNEELGKRYDKIVAFERAADRCIANLKLVGSLLSLLAVL